MKETHQPFRIKSSKRLPENDVIKYKNIHYTCKHAGSIQVRGKGIRLNQRYMALGCELKLIIGYNAKLNKLRVIKYAQPPDQPGTVQTLSPKQEIDRRATKNHERLHSNGSKQERDQETN